MATYNPEKPNAPVQGYPQLHGTAPPPALQQEPVYGEPQQTVYAQPTTQTQMAVAPYNSNPLNKNLDAKGQRDWDHGLCSCMGDCGTCCLACWCPCIVYGQNKTRFATLKNGQVHPQGGEGCGTDGILYCAVQCFTGFGWIFQFIQRTEIRERYNIAGSAFGDCCTSCCCVPCDLTQQSREIRDEEDALMGKVPKHSA